MSVKVGGKHIKMTGSYSVDGNKLTVKAKDPEGKEQSDTDTITKLTDKELHLKDDKGKAAEFMRKQK